MFRNVIDTDDYGASGIEVLRFAGGEWHAKVPRWPGKNVHVFAKLRTPNDVMALVTVVDALHTQGVESYLFAPYFPGLRQDRNPDGLTPLTARIYGRLLAPYFAAVTTVDDHSAAGQDQAFRYFNRRHTEIKPETFLPDLINGEYEPSLVIAPDNGAVERSTEAASALRANLGLAEKARDFNTGQLTGFRLTKRPGTNGRILIADDICDGGGTFAGLLEEIRKYYPDNPVDLYVTHGIFSKGFGPLEGFDRIYTTDSWYRDFASDRVHTINLLPYYFGGLRP